jgi:GxxExxY protein
MKDIMELCDTVRETSFAIHRYHKHGHLEKVYENALAHRLRNLGLDVKQQHPLTVYDEDGTVIGEYFADLFVDNRLIIELKAVKALADEHIAQLLGYLRASRIEHGLLINFGAPRFEIRKYALFRTGDDSPRGGLASALVSLSSLFASFASFRGEKPWSGFFLRQSPGTAASA